MTEQHEGECHQTLTKQKSIKWVQKAGFVLCSHHGSSTNFHITLCGNLSSAGINF